MRPKSIVLLVLALGCGLVAAMGINQVLKRDNTPTAPAESTAILVAQQEINMGDKLKPEFLRIEEWPADKVPEGTLTKVEDIEDRIVRGKIFPGEPIIEGKLRGKGENADGLDTNVPVGKRAVSIRVDSVSIAGGLVLPGNHVDMLVHLVECPQKGISKTCTRTFLQDIKVAAVDNIYQRDANGETTIAAKTVTLEATPREAQLITMASELGTIRLSLRNGIDESKTEIADVSPSELMGESEPTSSQPTKPASGTDLLAALNNAQKEPPPPVEPPVVPTASGDVFKMVVLEGAGMREVEFRDGKPINLDTGAGGAIVAPPVPTGAEPAEPSEPDPAEPEPTTTTQTSPRPRI